MKERGGEGRDVMRGKQEMEIGTLKHANIYQTFKYIEKGSRKQDTESETFKHANI